MTHAARLAAGVVLAVLLAWVCVGLAAGNPPPRAADADAVVLILFHGEGCPHCAAEQHFLADELGPAYPELTVEAYEVWRDEANRALMVQAAAQYGFEPGPVPVTIVEGPAGAEVFIGFGSGSGPQIEAAVVRALEAAEAAQGSPPAGQASDLAGVGSVVEVPLVGEVDLAGSSVLRVF